jgi:hypothetical protein
MKLIKTTIILLIIGSVIILSATEQNKSNDNYELIKKISYEKRNAIFSNEIKDGSLPNDSSIFRYAENAIKFYFANSTDTIPKGCWLGCNDLSMYPAIDKNIRVFTLSIGRITRPFDDNKRAFIIPTPPIEIYFGVSCDGDSYNLDSIDYQRFIKKYYANSITLDLAKELIRFYEDFIYPSAFDQDYFVRLSAESDNYLHEKYPELQDEKFIQTDSSFDCTNFVMIDNNEVVKIVTTIKKNGEFQSKHIKLAKNRKNAKKQNK